MQTEKAKPGRKKKVDRVPASFTPGFIANLDQRTGIAQLMGDRFQELTADLGGVDRLSYSQKLLAEKALWIQHYMGLQEAQLAAGKFNEFDAGKYSALLNSLQGVLAKLGLQRVARDVQSLGDYLKSKQHPQGAPQQ